RGEAHRPASTSTILAALHGFARTLIPARAAAHATDLAALLGAALLLRRVSATTSDLAALLGTALLLRALAAATRELALVIRIDRREADGLLAASTEIGRAALGVVAVAGGGAHLDDVVVALVLVFVLVFVLAFGLMAGFVFVALRMRG